jgi:glycosyltransferase involved in cell wall biosynthesis
VRIGFNAQIISNVDAGVGNYARNLLMHLVNAAPKHEFYIFGSDQYLGELQIPGAYIVPTHQSVHGSFRRILWEQLILPFKTKRHHLDVMVYPDHTAPILIKSCPLMITVHDLAFLALPEAFPSSTRIYKTLALQRSVERVDKIIAVSETTKKECLRLLDVPESKIEVIYRGLESHLKQIHDQSYLAKIRNKLHLHQKFILFVGTLEPRKNIVRLLQAYSLLKKSREIDHRLVIVGQKGWLFTDIFKEIDRLTLNNDVHLLGYVGQDDLVALYNLAEVFIYPSLYEGFGLPPLEAMACGCPVITSNISSLPEITGDAALLVDPYDIEALSDAMFQVVHNIDCRELLREKGFQRVKEFVWQRTAHEMLKVIDELGNEHH